MPRLANDSLVVEDEFSHQIVDEIFDDLAALSRLERADLAWEKSEGGDLSGTYVELGYYNEHAVERGVSVRVYGETFLGTDIASMIIAIIKEVIIPTSPARQ